MVPHCSQLIKKMIGSSATCSRYTQCVLNFQEPCSDMHALVLCMPVPVIFFGGWWQYFSGHCATKDHFFEPLNECGDKHPRFLLAAKDQTQWGEIERWFLTWQGNVDVLLDVHILLHFPLTSFLWIHPALLLHQSKPDQSSCSNYGMKSHLWIE